LLLLELRL